MTKYIWYAYPPFLPLENGSIIFGIAFEAGISYGLMVRALKEEHPGCMIVGVGDWPLIDDYIKLEAKSCGMGISEHDELGTTLDILVRT